MDERVWLKPVFLVRHASGIEKPIETGKWAGELDSDSHERDHTSSRSREKWNWNGILIA